MNNRNEQDKRNYLAFLEYFGLLFYASVIVLIVVSIVFVQSGHKNTLKTKEKQELMNCNQIGQLGGLALLVKARQTYIVNKDWSEDSTMTDRKRETLNEILAR